GVSRSERCRPHRSLRIARVLRMDTRAADTPPPPRCERWKGVPVAVPRRPAALRPPGIWLRWESVLGFGRCSASVGIGVRFQSERPLGFHRNLHATLTALVAELPGGTAGG